MLSDGEIHFLWWFIQGSIMTPSTRQRLRQAWGMCERHAWGYLVVDAAFRHGYLHGPVVLYEDLMQRALATLAMPGPARARRVIKGLRGKGPCLICDIGYGPESAAQVKEERLIKGRDLSELRGFARRTEPHWRHDVCGRCLGDYGSASRCRSHLIEDWEAGARPDLFAYLVEVKEMASRLTKYSRSFVFEKRGTATDEDRSALISAVGWCSGWRTLMNILEQ